ncbi:MAG: serine/threonine protein kinase, partial [Myxococcales bacterium]|nr:serine/threonine protein kinase [Myxococcales bacterium]
MEQGVEMEPSASRPRRLDSQLQLAALRARVLETPREDVMVGRFRLLERIGAGGMGVVYAARDDALHRRIALKLIHDELADDPRARARVLSEARALARLSHPNVVQLHEIGEHRSRLFIAMEYINGPTLREWATQRARSVREIIDVYIQAGTGLAAAHAAGIVHRDFKCDNVMIGADDRVRVLDFGLVSALRAGPGDGDGPARPGERDDARTRDPLLTSDATAPGFAGTPAYMAAGQFAGSTVDARTDQFGFCVALHEAL